MMKRQVGSTMKPLLYYAALENGMTSSSTFLSQETTLFFHKMILILRKTLIKNMLIRKLQWQQL